MEPEQVPQSMTSTPRRRRKLQTAQQVEMTQQQPSQINNSTHTMNKPFSFLKKPITILSILLIISIAGFVYYFIQYNKVTHTPADQARENTAKVVRQIKSLMYIADDSNAVLAVITDKSKLANEKFFDSAENGDDVVLFPALMKAVLYRPSINKIIDVGPFTPNAPQQQTATTTAPVSKTTTPATKTTASSTKAK